MEKGFGILSIDFGFGSIARLSGFKWMFVGDIYVQMKQQTY